VRPLRPADRCRAQDLVPLYCHAFRSHPKETYQMDVAAAASSRGPSGTLLTGDIQGTLRLSAEQQQHMLNSAMRYLSAVKARAGRAAVCGAAARSWTRQGWV